MLRSRSWCARPFGRGLLTGACLLLLGAAAYAQGIITTVAGSTWNFPSGTLTPANAPLGAVRAVAVSATGEVYATDFGNRRVVKINSTGTSLTVVAGNGSFGFSGDGGPATSAALSLVFGVAVDGSNNVFIADTLNHVIRRVDGTTGIITTVAGTAGLAGLSGDTGAASSAKLNSPTGVAVSGTDIYVADRDNHRIRKFAVGGNIITAAGSTSGFSGDTVVGGATAAQFNQPSGVAVDSSGNVLIADSGNHRIRKLTVSTVTVTTVAGNGTATFAGDGGAATSASINGPLGVALDSSNNLYIADSLNNRLRKVTGTTISTLAGSGGFGYSGDGGAAAAATMATPSGVAVDGSGNVFIADTDNSRVRKVTGATINLFAGNGSFKYGGDTGPALSASMNTPNSVAMDPNGNLYIADTSNHRIRKVSAAGTITNFAGTGEFGFSGENVAATSAKLNSPSGVAVDRNRNVLYIADTFNHRIRRVDLATGTITTFAGNGLAGFTGDGVLPTNTALNRPFGVIADPISGDVYIADTNNNRVRKAQASGGTIDTVAGTGTAGFADGGAGQAKTVAQLNSPVAVALDATAANLYIADQANHRIRKLAIGTATVTTVAGTGTAGFADGAATTTAQLNSPSGVAVDVSGNVYIGDQVNHRVRKVAGGTVSTVAGTGSFGFSGDGGDATVATLGGPSGLTLDAFGNLYVADSFNDRVRKLFAGLITAGSAQGLPGAVVKVPVTLTLFGGATLNSIVFGFKVVPNGIAPALGTALSFTKATGFPDPVPSTTGNDSISVSWLSQGTTPPFPLGGAVKLGDVNVTIPNTAVDAQTYTLKITGADGNLNGATVPLSPGVDSNLVVAVGSYLPGDVNPQLVDLNGDGDKSDPLEFGDGVLTIADLIDVLRAISFPLTDLPVSCSARFNAMDTAGAGGTAGSNNLVDVNDLIIMLRRLTNLEPPPQRRSATAGMLSPSCVG